MYRIIHTNPFADAAAQVDYVFRLPWLTQKNYVCIYTKREKRSRNRSSGKQRRRFLDILWHIYAVCTVRMYEYEPHRKTKSFVFEKEARQSFSSYSKDL